MASAPAPADGDSQTHTGWTSCMPRSGRVWAPCPPTRSYFLTHRGMSPAAVTGSLFAGMLHLFTSLATTEHG